MTPTFRCDCPITSALDLLGDRWVLVIIKQMLIEGKQTFKEFTESDEAIATNILAAKLKCLEGYGLVERTDHPSNKKTKLYRLTERGLSLAPIVVELALWSDRHLRELHPLMQQSEALESMKSNKDAFIETLQQGYRAKNEA